MTFIIAEAGVCHNGNVAEAYLLADAAKEAGADCVKFQHFNSQRLWGDDRIKNLELSDAEMATVAWHCKSIGIEFMCTPFGVKEVEFLTPLVKRWKVASGCLQRKGLLEAIGRTKLPIILSTGMSNLDAVRNGLDLVGYQQPAFNTQDYTLLHCTSAYPCPINEVNLASMDTLRFYFGDRCKIGYSDHTPGITIAIAAVARGAVVLEKHLTLDRNQEGPDHKTSIEPKEFRVMVSAIRMVEEAIGKDDKKVQPSELPLKAAWHGN